MSAISVSKEIGSDLLQQLELILEHDKFIDEVGFIHPTQFAALNEISDGSVCSTANMVQSVDEFRNKDTLELHTLQYDKTVFWNNNHKLAISVQVLPQLYDAALHAYMDVNSSYKWSTRSSLNEGPFDNATSGVDFDHLLESEILKHTRVLLILSYDFKSAWNSRKLALLRRQELSLFMDEFQLSTLILSYAPKSESAWSHRRWAIKMLAGKVHDLQELVEKESVLVKNIAEKSKMNYRAWNHRCWLVLYMTKSQVLDELNNSRKWAELHVADNCCFHYRRRLMYRILEDNIVKKGEDISFNHTYSIWKEELQWNKLLIQRCIGREKRRSPWHFIVMFAHVIMANVMHIALWIHRRFLSQCWMQHFTASQKASSISLEARPCMTLHFDDFLHEELELVHACLDIPKDGFDDCQSQAKHAASYILWISKQIPLHQEAKLHEKLKEVGCLKAILIKECPEKLLLWEKLLD